jgi:hypothetical protein
VAFKHPLPRFTCVRSGKEDEDYEWFGTHFKTMGPFMRSS